VHVAVVGVQGAERVVGGLVLAHDPLVRVGVAGVAVVRADDAGQLRRALVGAPVISEVIARGQRAAAVGVVARPIAISSAPRLA
jgi:hypothetical protein